MNVKLGQLDLFSPLCKICEKTRLCYPTGLSGRVTHVVSGQCPDYGKLPGYKSVCVSIIIRCLGTIRTIGRSIFTKKTTPKPSCLERGQERISKGHLSNDFYNLVLYVVSRLTVRAWGVKRDLVDWVFWNKL